MIRVLIAAALLAVLPWTVGAQVEKQVEVTKAYVPSVGDASKLAIIPDMTDTTRMRPEIDYTITPLSLHTTLETRPIRPATVTYWEFNRPLPFYLKAGAGYPLNSVLDFYASSQNPGTGYVVGYLNHEGRYAKIANELGSKLNSTRMTNRIGAAAGKYLGRHILEGNLSYENRLYHRYGLPDMSLSAPAVDYGDANVTVRLGDDFKDLSRVNFEVALHGGFFFDHSDGSDYNSKARQTDFGVDAKIARGFGRHRLSLAAGYQRIAGLKAIDDYRQHLLHAALRYGVEGEVIDFEAGADYFHDKNRGVKTGNYIIPFVRLDLNLGTPGLKPFIELDGRLRDNSFRSLTLQNPYVAPPVDDAMLGPLFAPNKSSVDYNARFGVSGSLWRERFTYRLYAGFSIHDNHLYWYGAPMTIATGVNALEMSLYPGLLLPSFARQTVTSFNGEVEWRPVSPLRLWLGAHGYIYNDDTSMYNGSPSFRGDAGVRYEGRKIAFGVSAAVQSVRKWTSLIDENNYMTFEAPFAVDLRVMFEWKVSGRVALFAEGRNLANRRLYEFPWFPEYGANCTVGVKMNF